MSTALVPQSNNSVFSAPKSEQGFDIRRILGLVFAKWYLFLLFPALALALAFLYIRWTPKIYQVNAELLVDESQKQGGASSMLNGDSQIFQDFGGLLNTASNVDNEVEILKTRTLMDKVVRDLELNVNYFVKGRLRSVELYDNAPFRVILVNGGDSLNSFGYQWTPVSKEECLLTDKEAKTTVRIRYGTVIQHNHCGFLLTYLGTDDTTDLRGKYSFSVVPYYVATSSYMKSLMASIPNKQVSTIELSITSPLPRKGEAVMSHFIETYIQSSLDERNKIADSTLSFINLRLVSVSRELQDIEGAVSQYKGQNKLINPDEQSSLMADTYNENYKQNFQIDAQIAILKTLVDYIKDGKNNQRVVPSYLLTQDPTFIQLVSKYNSLMIQRDRATLNLTDENPIIQNLDLQLANLRKDMLNNLAVQEQSFKQTKASLADNDQTFERQISSAPQIERGYLQLARQQKIKEELYLFLVQKREETAITRASNIASSRVIDAPKADEIPIEPKKTKVVVIAFLIGLIIPSLIVYVANLLNVRIASREDVDRGTAATVIGEINHYEKRGDFLPVVAQDPRSAIAEQFRAVRTNLEFLMNEGPCKVIMLTSSMSGEGKSFISLNLAHILSMNGKRTLLMELDLRKPKISKYLNISNTEGFSNYMVSNVPIRSLIKPLDLDENLFLLCSGPIPPNPAEMLSNKKVDELFQALRQEFDYIIVDSAPIGMVTDGQILSKHANVNLYVVRQRYTYKNQLNIVNDLLKTEKMRSIYLILNDVKLPGAYGYGYGNGYGYGYGYGENATERKGPLKRLLSGLKANK